MTATARRALLAAALLVAGCPKPGGLPRAERTSLAEALDGTWVEPAGGRFEVDRFDRDEAFVAYVIDRDGEVFQVLDAGWVDGTFAFTYLVPSTAYEVTFRVLDVQGDTLRIAWSNDAGGTGEKTYTRR